MQSHKASIQDFRSEFGKNYLDPDIYDYENEEVFPVNIVALSGRMGEVKICTEPNKVFIEFDIFEADGCKGKNIHCIAEGSAAERIIEHFEWGQYIAVCGHLTVSRHKIGKTWVVMLKLKCQEVFYAEPASRPALPIRKDLLYSWSGEAEDLPY